MKKVVKILVIAITAMAVLAFAVLILLIVSIRPSKVDAAQAAACRHYDNQTIMTKVIRAKTGDQAEWKLYLTLRTPLKRTGL